MPLGFGSQIDFTLTVVGLLLFCLVIAGYVTFFALEAHAKRIARANEDSAEMQRALVRELTRMNDLKHAELDALGMLDGGRGRGL